MLKNPDKTVSFFTCCYEADWEFFLKENRLKEMIRRCNYPFANRVLIINNVNDKEQIRQYACSAIKEGVIDAFYFSEEFIDEALKKILLKRRDFKLDGYDGYWYSIGPLTAAYLCKTDYILYFTGDCMLNDIYEFDWISKGLDELQNKNIMCVTPLWNYYDPKLHNYSFSNELCYYDDGFSDQAFLMRTEIITGNIYKEYNVKSEIFPIYGGNHFERRIYCYMNNKQLLRCVFKNIVYTHSKLIRQSYYSKMNNNRLLNEVKYTIAKIKRVFRRKNILVKYLLR